MKFEKLLSPGQIGSLRLKNRIVKPGQSMGASDKEGYVSEANLSFYETLAIGGVGLIIMESACVDFPAGTNGPHHMSIADDSFLPGIERLVSQIHNRGTPVVGQLCHGGPATKKEYSGQEPVAASTLTATQRPGPGDACRGLAVDEIQHTVEAFAKAAARAQKAGFDGIEVHAAHGYLINSFLSRGWNKRDDDYGGDLKNRARFLMEIIAAIRGMVGRDFPLWCRINAAEYGMKDGLTIQESAEIARMLEEATTNAIHVSAWGFGHYEALAMCENIFYPEPPEDFPAHLDGSKHGRGALVPLAAEIKKHLSVPVIAGGRLDPPLAEKIIKNGKADFAAMGRRLMADPELPNKLAAGRFEEIAPCTACLTCHARLKAHKPVECRINSRFGREKNFPLEPARVRKRVMVIGSGPSGMEAARVAALRGHDVWLFDKQKKLGGSLPLAALFKGSEIEDIPGIVRYFEVQLKKLKVKLRLGEDVNAEIITQLKPEVVIVAAGGMPATPEIAGMDSPNVRSSTHIYGVFRSYLRFFSPGFLRFLTRFWMPLGKNVVIIGAGIQGCELAEFLVKRGRAVVLVSASSEVGTGMPDLKKARLLKWLEKNGARIRTNVKCDKITREGLVVTSGGERDVIKADSIVPVVPLKPNQELFNRIDGKVPEVYLTGDCQKPGSITDAIHAGFAIGYSI